MLPGRRVTKSIATGSGSSGATDGADIALSWISAQIGQSESPSPPWREPRGVVWFECDASIVEAAAAARKCTWPNVSTNCSATAISARRAPKCLFVRNQRINGA